MQVYAFDLMPWPHLEAPSHYPDPNRLYDPPRGRQLYDEHLRQMETVLPELKRMPAPA